MSNILPTVGRIVLYKSILLDTEVSPQSGTQPAIITEVREDGKISLCVFLVNGNCFLEGVEQGEGNGQWDWMPFQKDQQARLAKEEEAKA